MSLSTSWALALLLGAIAGCGAGSTPSNQEDPPKRARSAARTFAQLYFDGHQAGQLRPGDWAHLQDVTTPAVAADLRGQYQNIPKPAPWGGCPAVDVKVERWRDDTGNRKVLADIRARCENGPVGLGVPLSRRPDGGWVVTSLRDARCDAGAPRIREVDCSAFRAR